MLTFLVLLDSKGVDRAGRAMPQLRERQPDEVPFTAFDQVFWTNDSGTIWFAAWASAPAGQHDHWVASSSGVTAVSSKAWPRFQGWKRGRPWIDQLAEFCAADPAKAADDLGGVFTLTHLDGCGGVVAADPLGMGLLYQGMTDGLLILSNRASMVARALALAGRTPTRDVAGACWLAYAGYNIGSGTGFAGVSVLDAGVRVRIEADGSARLEQSVHLPWRGDASDLLDDLPAAVDVVRQEMHVSIQELLVDDSDGGGVELTGGKDSRLVLALLLEAGAADAVLFRTYGSDELPDVVVAQDLCKAFGLRHERNPSFGDIWAWSVVVEAAIREQCGQSLSSREMAFRVTAWAGAGMMSVKESSLMPPSNGPPSLLGGLFGEIMRSNYPGTAGFRSKVDASSLPDQLGFGEAHLLRRSWSDEYRSRMHEVLFAGVTDTHSPHDVVDMFFVKQRLRGWFAPSHEFNSTNRGWPLYSMSAARLAYAMGGDNRLIEWLPYTLMAKACPALLAMPLGNGCWDDRAAAPPRPPRQTLEPIPPTPPQRPRGVRSEKSTRTFARTLRAERRAEDVALFEHALRHLDNPVFEIIDPDALQDLVRRFDTASEVERDQAYGALTAAIWVSGEEIARPLPPGLPQRL